MLSGEAVAAVGSPGQLERLGGSAGGDTGRNHTVVFVIDLPLMAVTIGGGGGSSNTPDTRDSRLLHTVLAVTLPTMALLSAVPINSIELSPPHLLMKVWYCPTSLLKIVRIADPI